MMPRDLGGVFDDQLRVYGVEGLRVADISFWPMPLNGAPSATMYASAEIVRSLPLESVHTKYVPTASVKAR